MTDKEAMADPMREVQRLGQEIEQEPVAWLCTPNEDGLFGLPLSDKGCKDCFPVYRHPQKNGYAEEKNAICSPFMISELWKLHK